MTFVGLELGSQQDLRFNNNVSTTKTLIQLLQKGLQPRTSSAINETDTT